MIHIKRFIDKVSMTESKHGKDFVMPIIEARGLRDELAKRQGAMSAVEDAAKGEDPKVIQDLVQAMFKAMGPLMTAKQQQEEKAKDKPADDNVVDAEVKESV
jgi:hypothetical protein